MVPKDNWHLETGTQPHVLNEQVAHTSLAVFLFGKKTL